MVRILAGAGMALLIVGSAGLLAGAAEAAAPPATSTQVLSQALALADAAPSASSGNATEVTSTALPTGVAGGLGTSSSSPNPAWPTWAIIAGMAVLIVGTMLFSLFDKRGSRQA